MSDLDFMDDALCAQTIPDVFLPQKGGSTLPAKRICAACDVRAICLEYALANDVRGIWGGTSDRDRHQMRKDAA